MGGGRGWSWAPGHVGQRQASVVHAACSAAPCLLLWVLRLQVKQLRDHYVGHVVINRACGAGVCAGAGGVRAARRGGPAACFACPAAAGAAAALAARETPAAGHDQQLNCVLEGCAWELARLLHPREAGKLRWARMAAHARRGGPFKMMIRSFSSRLKMS